MRFLAHLFMIIFVIIRENQSASEGDQCNKDGKVGTCQKVSSCQSAVWEIARNRSPKVCSLDESEPIVCCFEDKTIVTQNLSEQFRMTQTAKESVIVDRYATSELCETIEANLTRPKTGRKAWDKCIEYQEKYIYPCEKAVTLVGDVVRANYCGHNAEELIFGGVNAKEGEFPHMVLLGFGEDSMTAMWMCGGSIISEKFVLTAGHCTSDKKGVPVKFVRTAVLNRYDKLDERHLYSVARVVKHHKYQSPKRYHDIALLETNTRINLDPFVIPACLPLSGASYKDQKAMATGFGLTEMRIDANILQKVTLTKFSTDECTEFGLHIGNRNLKHGIESDTQMCYGDKKEIRDTCQGDSGGPLQIYNTEIQCMYTVIGITSFGLRKCGSVQNDPGVYVNVAAYTEWIESQVWPN